MISARFKHDNNMTGFEKEVSVVILAGGEGQRMGGRDKGLIVYHGKPLIEHVLDIIPPGVAGIVISANRNLERYCQYGQVVADEEEDFAGPLAGILTAMQHTDTPYLLVLPCDTPDLPPELPDRLYQALKSQQADIAVASSGERQHFVIALLKTDLRDDLQDYLASGERRVGHWQRRHKVVYVEFDSQGDRFRNINKPEQLLEQ
jgi:molybdenum cofactor guanylyltransferase